MDNRRFDTVQLLRGGILDSPLPKTSIPHGEREEYSVDVGDIEESALQAKLEGGVILTCSEYYGIPYLWKEDAVYHGTLLQDRAVTEDHTFATADEALAWFIKTARSVAG